jgi:hypothetical protein
MRLKSLPQSGAIQINRTMDLCVHYPSGYRSHLRDFAQQNGLPRLLISVFAVKKHVFSLLRTSRLFLMPVGPGVSSYPRFFITRNSQEIGFQRYGAPRGRPCHTNDLPTTRTRSNTGFRHWTTSGMLTYGPKD